MANERTGRDTTVLAASALCVLALFSAASAVSGAEEMKFALRDAFGREVRSQDYAGVPVFLEFGACW